MQYIPAKTIVTKTKSNGWFGMDYNMNIYRGCCHGCIYCDSRSDCYHIDDFEWLDNCTLEQLDKVITIVTQSYTYQELKKEILK